ncbi:hypothetical protein BU23DRAFT_404173, partial [Bimuria novae-zelandiae CBS 107.79]
RGAGSLLVQWGVNMSTTMGLDCYVQASEQGQRLYQHHRFTDLDTVEFDLTDYDLDGTEKMTAMIRRP